MIGINGMAHVILTVSRFDLARAFYGKLLRRYARLLRSLRLARPRSNDVRLIFHGTPLVRKSSACEMSQSTVTRGSGELLLGLRRHLRPVTDHRAELVLQGGNGVLQIEIGEF